MPLCCSVPPLVDCLPSLQGKPVTCHNNSTQPVCSFMSSRVVRIHWWQLQIPLDALCCAAWQHCNSPSQTQCIASNHTSQLVTCLVGIKKCRQRTNHNDRDVTADEEQKCQKLDKYGVVRRWPQSVLSWTRDTCSTILKKWANCFVNSSICLISLLLHISLFIGGCILC